MKIPDVKEETAQMLQTNSEYMDLIRDVSWPEGGKNLKSLKK